MAASSHPLVLASASAGRKGLLESVGMLPDTISPSDIDETQKQGESPRDFVLRLAIEKAAVAARRHPKSFIIAADTIAAVGRRILGKAATLDDARAMLQLLSGRRHKVYSGVCVVAPGGKKSARVVVTTVKFKPLNEAELEAYLASRQWEGKSGCYGIQSRAGGFVEFLNGSFSNVVGLPLVETKNMLAGLGFTHPALGNLVDAGQAPSEA
jgi:septum formation protein